LRVRSACADEVLRAKDSFGHSRKNMPQPILSRDASGREKAAMDLNALNAVLVRNRLWMRASRRRLFQGSVRNASSGLVRSNPGQEKESLRWDKAQAI
jgi:hypothetical protein